MAAYQFTPLINFSTQEGNYNVGLSYTVRDGNKRLDHNVIEWLATGKVKIITFARSVASVSGAGNVEG